MPQKVVQQNWASVVGVFLGGEKMGIGGVFAGISPVLGRFALDGARFRKREKRGRREGKREGKRERKREGKRERKREGKRQGKRKKKREREQRERRKERGNKRERERDSVCRHTRGCTPSVGEGGVGIHFKGFRATGVLKFNILRGFGASYASKPLKMLNLSAPSARNPLQC